MAAYTQEQRFDHARDLRKHDSPSRSTMPPIPDRLNKPLTTAMDIVVLVKALSNYSDAAALVEQYAQMIASGARVDECRKTWDEAIKKLEVPRRHILSGGLCVTCSQYTPGDGIMPPHDASPRCESGKRPHCTCDTCF